MRDLKYHVMRDQIPRSHSTHTHPHNCILPSASTRSLTAFHNIYCPAPVDSPNVFYRLNNPSCAFSCTQIGPLDNGEDCPCS